MGITGTHTGRHTTRAHAHIDTVRHGDGRHGGRGPKEGRGAGEDRGTRRLSPWDAASGPALAGVLPREEAVSVHLLARQPPARRAAATPAQSAPLPACKTMEYHRRRGGRPANQGARLKNACCQVATGLACEARTVTDTCQPPRFLLPPYPASKGLQAQREHD